KYKLDHLTHPVHDDTQPQIPSPEDSTLWRQAYLEAFIDTSSVSITSVISHLLGSSRTAFTTKAISGNICARLHASPFSDFATRLSRIRRFLSWPMITRATGFPAHYSGRIGHTPSYVFTRRRCCSPSNCCLRISTFLIRRFHGLSCLHTRTTAGDELLSWD